MAQNLQDLHNYGGDDQVRIRGGALLRDAGPFANRRCHDLVFAVLFLVAVAGMICLAFGMTAGLTFNDIDKHRRDLVPFRSIFVGLLITVMVAFCLSLGTVHLAKNFPEKVIWMSLLSAPSLMIVTALGFLASSPERAQGVVVCLMLVVPALLILACLYCWRDLVHFTAQILRPVAAVIASHFIGVACVGLLGITMIFFYTVFAALGIVGAYSLSEICSDPVTKCQGSPNSAFATYFVEVLLLVWGGTTFTNMCHVTYCGIVGRWYFNREASVYQSLIASLTSFGSICFGSLIVSIIQAAHAVVNAMARDNARDSDQNAAVQCVKRICAMVVECLLQCVQDLVEFMSYYAYVQVAVRGFSFLDSVRATYALCKFSNINATNILGTSLVETVVSMASLACGVFAGVASAVAAYSLRPAGTGTEEASSIAVLSFALGVSLGFACAGMILFSLKSGFATIVVCWAEDRESLSTKSDECHYMDLQFQSRTQVFAS